LPTCIISGNLFAISDERIFAWPQKFAGANSILLGACFVCANFWRLRRNINGDLLRHLLQLLRRFIYVVFAEKKLICSREFLRFLLLFNLRALTALQSGCKCTHFTINKVTDTRWDRLSFISHKK